MSTVQAIRTVLFYLLLSASAFVWGTLSFFIAPILPFRARYRFVVQNWCRFAIWLTRVVAGIRYEVRGLENIPEKPCVILSKHQSTWETFFLSGFFEPLSQVLKRELLYVPFFGWALALLKPIAIDRSQPKLALKQLAKQGDECLKKGAWVLSSRKARVFRWGRWASSPAAAPPWRSTPGYRYCRSPTTPGSIGPRPAGPSTRAPSRW